MQAVGAVSGMRKARALVQLRAVTSALGKLYADLGVDADDIASIERDYLAAARSDDFAAIESLRRELKAELVLGRIADARAAAAQIARGLGKVVASRITAVEASALERRPSDRTQLPPPVARIALVSSTLTAAPPATPCTQFPTGVAA